MMAGSTGIARGTASATRSTANELRVAVLKATLRAWVPCNPVSLATAQPIRGAHTAKAI